MYLRRNPPSHGLHRRSIVILGIACFALCGAATALGVLSSVGSAAVHALGQAGVERSA